MGKAIKPKEDIKDPVLQLNLERMRVYKRVFNSADGQKVLFDLMSNNFILSGTHIPNDPTSCHRNEGRRECVLAIMKLVDVDEDKFLAVVRKQSAYQQKNFQEED